MSEIEIAKQLVSGPVCDAIAAASCVPSTPGYYGIFIHDGSILPNPYGNILLERETRLIYIGIATVSLYDRLVKADLQHQRPSTFFRGLGSILGYRPPKGSLVGKLNKNNYTFTKADTAEIIKWIDGHLSVNWVEASPALEAVEAYLIRTQRPLLNARYNPEPIRQLVALRLECRKLACAIEVSKKPVDEMERHLREARIAGTEPILAGTGYWGRAEAEFANATANEKNPTKRKKMVRRYEELAEELKGMNREEREQILLNEIRRWKKAVSS